MAWFLADTGLVWAAGMGRKEQGQEWLLADTGGT